MRLIDPARRALLQTVLLASPAALLAQPAAPAAPNASRVLSLTDMVEPVVGKKPLRQGGMRLEIAALADNGHLVPARVVVDTVMSEADHVRRIVLLSPRNPVTRMATFHFGPWSGRGEVVTRIRLAGTQTVVALAEMASGEVRMAQAEVVVTESACLDMS